MVLTFPGDVESTGRPLHATTQRCRAVDGMRQKEVGLMTFTATLSFVRKRSASYTTPAAPACVGG